MLPTLDFVSVFGQFINSEGHMHYMGTDGGIDDVRIME